MVTGTNDKHAANRTGRQVLGSLFLALAALAFVTDTRAEDPAGTLTVVRDLPVRNAFRAGAPGEAYKVATAREDVIVTSTRHITVPAIANLPDSALDAVSSSMARSGVVTVTPMTGASPATVLGQTTARAPGNVIGGAMGALPTAGANRPMSAIGGTIASVLGGAR